MSASVIYGGDSFKSGASLADLILGRWSSNQNSTSTVTLNATNGRFGGQSYRIVAAGGAGSFTGNLRKTGLGNQSTGCLNFPFKTSAWPVGPSEIAAFLDGATIQASLVLNADGTLSIYRGGQGGTLLATSSSAITLNTYATYEFKATLATGTGGTIELRAWGSGFPSSGSVIASTGSLNTAASGVGQMNGYQLGEATSRTNQTTGMTWDYEHFLCLDDFLGDKQMIFQLPTGNPTAVWTPNASTNLSRVQEAQEDGDTSYISSGNSGDIDYYSFAALPAGTQGIFAVRTSIWHKNDAAGTSQVRTKIKQGSTVVNGTTINPALSYAEQIDMAYVDPVSTVAFVKSDVDSLVNGVERV